MAELFGHSKDLITLSLSLSQVLTYNNIYINRICGRSRVNIRLFLQTGKEGRSVFYPRN